MAGEKTQEAFERLVIITGAAGLAEAARKLVCELPVLGELHSRDSIQLLNARAHLSEAISQLTAAIDLQKPETPPSSEACSTAGTQAAPWPPLGWMEQACVVCTGLGGFHLDENQLPTVCSSCHGERKILVRNPKVWSEAVGDTCKRMVDWEKNRNISSSESSRDKPAKECSSCQGSGMSDFERCRACKGAGWVDL